MEHSTSSPLVRGNVRRWSELYPDGVCICYKGDDPDGFAATVKQEFGFDPSADELWGHGPDVWDDDDEFSKYEFFCAAGHLDAIYGRFPMGPDLTRKGQLAGKPQSRRALTWEPPACYALSH
jgi:hypothetical protein